MPLARDDAEAKPQYDPRQVARAVIAILEQARLAEDEEGTAAEGSTQTARRSDPLESAATAK